MEKEEGIKSEWEVTQCGCSVLNKVYTLMDIVCVVFIYKVVQNTMGKYCSTSDNRGSPQKSRIACTEDVKRFTAFLQNTLLYGNTLKAELH